MQCPNCGYEPDAESDEFRSGGGWAVGRSITDVGTAAVQYEETNCPLCGELVDRTELSRSRYDDDRDLVPDGGQSSYRFEVTEESRSTVTYGPAGPDTDRWVLTATTEYGRVELELDEQPMYELWTEVRGVPWPPREGDQHDRLIRRVLQAANGADEQMLYDALDALGVRDE
ncbi:hypothetical protein ACFQL1_14935 [Halomicroarcula sp. GCM10025709]|uniref:hypothetical protein n=1 Tax=Haloarcula TaxID=2237 RepID=UPI0024C37306|nr:hypothetical protein [Halomicroarcula sp. YJ-61-S]